MSTSKEAYELGYNTGYSIAHDNISELLPDNASQSQIDDFISDCAQHEAEIYRQYSPFEFTACDFNASRYPDCVWDSYEHGIFMGIKRAVREYKRNRRINGKEG